MAQQSLFGAKKPRKKTRTKLVRKKKTIRLFGKVVRVRSYTRRRPMPNGLRRVKR